MNSSCGRRCCRVFLQSEEFLFHLKDAEFGLIQQDDFSRAKTQQLAADFGSDAARCSGHHDHSIAKERADSGHVELIGFAAEQVVDRDFPHLEFKST